MIGLRIYSVSDEYIDYLRRDPILYNVSDNKAGRRVHTRKYVGVVIEHNGYQYFAPFSSPKKTDYRPGPDGKRVIRKSVLPIIRMTSFNTRTRELELKGTIKLSNMIPVPGSELIDYDINREEDRAYRDLLMKEYAFIRAHAKQIVQYAKALYNQKMKENELFPDGEGRPRYLDSVVSYTYAEHVCQIFQEEKGISQECPDPKKKLDRMISDAKDRISRA